jgi:hypothetical protein
MPTTHTPSLRGLPIDDLRTAGSAIEDVIDFVACLPESGMLLMVATCFADDIRERLELPTIGRITPVPRPPLAQLSLEDLSRLDKAVGVLLGRFTGNMEDPELITLLTGVQTMLGPIVLAAEARAKTEALPEAEAQ